MSNRGRFVAGNKWASAGGKARAKALSPDRRREIAKLGFQGLVRSRFGGDVQKAKRYMAALGAWGSDQPYWGTVFQKHFKPNLPDKGVGV